MSSPSTLKLGDIAEALPGENIDAETGTQGSNTDGRHFADGGNFGIILSLSNEATTGPPPCRRRSDWRSYRRAASITNTTTTSCTDQLALCQCNNVDVGYGLGDNRELGVEMHPSTSPSESESLLLRCIWLCLTRIRDSGSSQFSRETNSITS